MTGVVPTLTTAVPLSTMNSWHYCVVTFQGGVSSGSQMYVDGVATRCSFTMSVQNQTVGPFIGYGNVGRQYRTGGIDEARISSTVRSADWILAEYNNQSSPSTFYALANISPSACTPSLSLMGVGACGS